VGGLVTQVTDQNGHSVDYTYDALGRVTEVEKDNGDSVTYTYDTTQAGALYRKTDGNGRYTTYSYTNRYQLSSATYPVSAGVNTSESWTYNANGDVATHVDGKSQTKTYGYDNASRLISIDYPTGTDTSFGYDDINRLTSLVDSTGSTGYTYDAANRLTQIASPNGTVSYTYDDASRRATMVISGSPNQTYTYGYDNADRLTSLQNPFSETTGFTYDDADRLTQQTFANGSYLAYGYDDRDRVTSISSKKANNTWQWQHVYTYDGVGNVVTRRDYAGDPTDNIYKQSAFEYDEADQLEKETFTAEVIGSPHYVTYTYDHNGNRTQKAVTQNMATTTTTYAHDWQDRLTSATTGSNVKTYLYDNNGACTTVKLNGTTTATLSYDYENRVTSLAQPSVTTNTFTYNGDNLRASKVDSAGTFTYLTDGTSPASSVLKDGAATYTPGISERRGTTSKFYHTDALGSVRGITDSTQATTDTVRYDAFGNVASRTGSTPTPFLFAGGYQYQTDGDSGLMLLGHRYYDPSIGRFLSKDPAKDGDNWYAYCENNPLSWVDPRGLEKITLPPNPGGLPTGPGGWKPIPHGDPNGGTRWGGPSGQDGLEYHPGKPGKPGFEGKDHWHRLHPKPGKPGKWEKEDEHLLPGEEVEYQPAPVPSPYVPYRPRIEIDWGKVTVGVVVIGGAFAIGWVFGGGPVGAGLLGGAALRAVAR
jgi:RHS repeat-associated protein